jgi:hypothetical protein
VIEDTFWPREEVLRYLKGGHKMFSFHGFDELRHLRAQTILRTFPESSHSEAEMTIGKVRKDGLLGFGLGLTFGIILNGLAGPLIRITSVSLALGLLCFGAGLVFMQLIVLWRRQAHLERDWVERLSEALKLKNQWEEANKELEAKTKAAEDAEAFWLDEFNKLSQEELNKIDTDDRKPK